MSQERRKIVFIDIDGTLVGDDGNVPESAQIACKKARENGHLLYLCTGRSKAEIYDEIWDIGFDGLIGAGGGYVESGSETLYHKRVNVNKVCFLESSLSFEQIKREFHGKFEAIQCTIPLFGEDSGELMIPGIHKAVAIADLLDHLNIPREDSMAIGDGMNDAEMLEYCAIGIAMGNAKPALKELANDITGNVGEDGLYQSFVKYGLISG